MSPKPSQLDGELRTPTNAISSSSSPHPSQSRPSTGQTEGRTGSMGLAEPEGRGSRGCSGFSRARSRGKLGRR